VHATKLKAKRERADALAKAAVAAAAQARADAFAAQRKAEDEAKTVTKARAEVAAAAKAKAELKEITRRARQKAEKIAQKTKMWAARVETARVSALAETILQAKIAVSRAARASKAAGAKLFHAFRVASSANQVRANLEAKEHILLAGGKKKVEFAASCSGAFARYNKFGAALDTHNGFDMSFSAMGINGVHIAFMTDKVERSADAWEIVIGGWGNTRSVIRSGTQGKELISVQNSASIGPVNKWRFFWLSYDADSGMLSIWDDTGNYGDNPLMSVQVPRLSKTVIYPAFGCWGSPVAFKAPIYVDMLKYDDYMASQGGLARTVDI